MNRRLFSIVLILAVTLGAVSWLKAGNAQPIASGSVCYPLGTLALLALGVWGLMRLFCQRRADESDGTKSVSEEVIAETPLEQDDSDESDGFGGSDADEDA
jgi:hypothetical protein